MCRPEIDGLAKSLAKEDVEALSSGREFWGEGVMKSDRMSSVEVRSILVATGLGAESDAPIRLAGHLAARAGAELHLMHALELQAIAPTVGVGDPSPDFRTLLEDTEVALEEKANQAVPVGLELTSREVIIYVPYKAILNQARKVEADLIVLGAHRRRPGGELLLGPIADRVVRGAEAPCLIVPEVEPEPFRRIVAPIDIEMPAALALDLAQIWALEFGPEGESAQIDLLYVTPERGGLGGIGMDEAQMRKRLESEIERSYQRVVGLTGLAPSEVRRASVPIEPVIRRGGRPALEINDYVEEVGADLVVLGTRGFGAIRRALIGSVASTLGRAAPTSILLVPPVLWRGRGRGIGWG